MVKLVKKTSQTLVGFSTTLVFVRVTVSVEIQAKDEHKVSFLIDL